ncbi:hypothetical protein [Pseudomonas sp. A-R-26]|uniref:hypothetical protein n=1 Tax=Pseudomonas sp. A-R-26 TaxID=2832404 RepID=UPI001CBCD973|nr:hypothetical protein [Pseudomonas sp. A-R-26]
MSAESKFREAFQRLKQDCPVNVARGTPISQNNIAREAGLDPSALKKARFPSLIEEIQQWMRDHENITKQSTLKSSAIQRKRNRDLKEKIKDLKAQRDHAISLLLDADTLILKLTKENIQLKLSASKSSKVKKIEI